MARLSALSLSLFLAIACGDDSTPAMDAGPADSGSGDAGSVDADTTDANVPDVPRIPGTDIEVQTFNLALAGAFVPNEAARRAPVIDAVANLDSDIVCLQEVWEQSDKDLVIAAASANFPHIVSHTTDFSTPITSPEDQNGEIPTPFATAPCAGYETELAAAVDCLAANCSTMPGSEAGQTTSTACATEFCVEAVATLLFGDADQQRCYSCLTTQLPTEPFSDMRDLCTNETNATLAFRGQSSSMILSKFPLSEPVNYVVPGSWNQRVVTIATATLPSGAEVDVYCNHLTPIFEAITFPYTGQYGAGMTGAEGWAAEQLLQVEKIITLVSERSATRPGIILGDLNTGTAGLGAGLGDEAPLTFERLREVYELGVARDFEAQCTYCSGNANNDPDALDVWIDHIFLHGLSRSQVTASERTFDEANVDAGGGVMVPPSDHYGIASTITIPEP
jgi:endonuclease/exonuclease/phosphatase family metal-dependent hydrolase